MYEVTVTLTRPNDLVEYFPSSPGAQALKAAYDTSRSIAPGFVSQTIIDDTPLVQRTVMVWDKFSSLDAFIRGGGPLRKQFQDFRSEYFRQAGIAVRIDHGNKDGQTSAPPTAYTKS